MQGLGGYCKDFGFFFFEIGVRRIYLFYVLKEYILKVSNRIFDRCVV